MLNKFQAVFDSPRIIKDFFSAIISSYVLNFPLLCIDGRFISNNVFVFSFDFCFYFAINPSDAAELLREP